MACALTSSTVLLAGSRIAKHTAQTAAAAPARLQQQQRRRRTAVTAAAGKPEQPSGPVQDFARGAERVLARYDFLSAGMGALLVTGFCVARGQDVGTALWITAAATVVALLVNDLLPEEH